MADVIQNVPQDSSQPAQNAQTNQNFQNIKNTLDTNIIKDLTGTPRVLMGKQIGQGGDPDFYGIKVSQVDNDVTSAADDKLVMSSAFNMFKIVQTGTATVTLANPVTHYSTTTTSVAHNLGKINPTTTK